LPTHDNLKLGLCPKAVRTTNLVQSAPH